MALSDNNSSIVIAIINQAALWLPIVTTVGSALAGVVVWLYRTKIKRELAANDAALLETLCRNAVAWVEQTVSKAQDESTADFNARRLREAAGFVSERARALGISVTDKQVLVFVEAAVLGLATPLPLGTPAS